jgi:hypothetical protein
MVPKFFYTPLPPVHFPIQIKVSIIALLNFGKSAGLHEVMILPSLATGSSTQVAPAFLDPRPPMPCIEGRKLTVL